MCESRELGGRRSSGFPCVKPVVKSSSGRVTFRIQSNINDGAPLKRAPPQTSVGIPGVDSTRSAVNFRGRGGGAVGGLRLYRIGSSKLVYKKVVEVRSNYISYKKS